MDARWGVTRRTVSSVARRATLVAGALLTILVVLPAVLAAAGIPGAAVP